MRTKRNIVFKNGSILVPFEHIDGVRDFCSTFALIHDQEGVSPKDVRNIAMLMDDKIVATYSGQELCDQAPLHDLQDLWLRENKRRVKLNAAGDEWLLKNAKGKFTPFCQHSDGNALADDLKAYAMCGIDWSPDDFDQTFDMNEVKPYQMTVDDRVYAQKELILALGDVFDKAKMYKAIELIANGAKFCDEDVRGRLHIFLDKASGEDLFIESINKLSIEMLDRNRELGMYLHGIYVGMCSMCSYMAEGMEFPEALPPEPKKKGK
ncbi:MAG: hypothetical protein K6B46_06635 [Opitutales bacterium]|nr:hypothetical protein [Opitutales bacterium]